MFKDSFIKLRYHVDALSPAAKASFWFVVANVMLKGISFITTPIFTRLLNVSDYGVTSIFVTWEGVISIFATLTLSGGCYNVAMAKFEHDIDRFTSCMLGLTAVCSVLVYSICIVFNEMFPKVFELRSEYLFFMWLQTFTNACTTFWLMRKRFIYQYKSVIAYTFVNALGGPIMAIAAIQLFPDNKAYAKIVGAGILAIVIGFVIMVQYLKRDKTIFDKKYWKFALGFSLPLLPHYLAGTLSGASDKIIINAVINSAATGIYSIAQSLSGVVGIVTMSINMSLIPYTLQMIKTKDYKSLRRTTTCCLLLVACFCAGIALFSREAILIFATQDYLGAVQFVAPLSFAAVILFLYGVIGNIVFYYEKTGCMSLITIVATAINISLNYWGIHQFGAIAAAYIALITNLVTMGGCYYFAKKYEHALNQIIDIKKIVFICLTYGGIVVYTLVFAENFWMRLALVGVLGLFLILFRKRLFNVIRSMRDQKT